MREIRVIENHLQEFVNKRRNRKNERGSNNRKSSYKGSVNERGRKNDSS